MQGTHRAKALRGAYFHEGCSQEFGSSSDEGQREACSGDVPSSGIYYCIYHPCGHPGGCEGTAGGLAGGLLPRG